MQREVLFFLVILNVLLVLPSISAEMSLQGPGKSTLNIGDSAVMSGYIIPTQDIVANLKFVLSCATDQQLLVKSLSLKQNTKKDFAETLLIPSYAEGTCVIKAIVDSSGKILEQATSPSFTISKDLTATFTLNKEEIKLGDPVLLTGSLTKLDGTPLNGVATIYFKQAGTDIFVDTVQIKNGQLKYTYLTKENPAGQYTIDVQIQDVYGNVKTFQAATFAIIGNILVFAESDKLHYIPGKKTKITGEATILDQPLKTGTATITLGETESQATVSNGKFSKTLEIPATMSSGTHQVIISIEDEFGNRGSAEVSIIIDPQSNDLELVTAQEAYQPGTTITITPVLKDQAGAVIDTDIGVVITNPKGKEVFSNTIRSNAPYEVHLEEQALPGTWNVHLFALGKKEDIPLFVEEKIILDYLIDNQTLFITNRGNIRFVGPVKVEYTGLDQVFTLVQESAINPAETSTLDLTKGIVPGTYDITVNDKVFEDIVITEDSLTKEEIMIIILAIIAAVLLIALFLYIRNWRRHTNRFYTPGSKVVSAHHPRSDDDHVSMFKQKMATEVESTRPKTNIKVKHGSSGDYYIYDIPQKKERSERERPPRERWTSSEEPPGWREPDSWSRGRHKEQRYRDYTYSNSSYRQEESSPVYRESSYQEPSYQELEPKFKHYEPPTQPQEQPKEKKGLFNMFS
jgi:hypothetical protein